VRREKGVSLGGKNKKTRGPLRLPKSGKSRKKGLGTPRTRTRNQGECEPEDVRPCFWRPDQEKPKKKRRKREMPPKKKDLFEKERRKGWGISLSLGETKKELTIRKKEMGDQ